MAEVRRKFHIDIPEELSRLASIFLEGGYALYLVGGAVRDAVLGETPKDFDVATDATPEQIKTLLRPHNYQMLELGEAFGVMALVLPYPLEKLEIATFREDLTAGRHPMVRFATIAEDVQRRDLTINALFYDIQRGEVVDHVGGLEDLERGIIRAVGDPKARFAEDRLRILRALRFAARMGNTLDPATSKAIEDDNSLKGVSPERIRDEFLKGVKSAKRVTFFLALVDRYRLWDQVFPGLKVAPGGCESRDPAVLLAVLLHGNDLQAVARKLNALKYSALEVSQVCYLIRLLDLEVDNAYRMRKQLAGTKLTDEEVRHFAYLMCFSPERMRLVNALLEYQLTVKGGDLMSEGYSGAALGKELERRETELFRRLVGA